MHQNTEEYTGQSMTDSLGNYIWFKQIKILAIFWKIEVKVGQWKNRFLFQLNMEKD